MRQIRILFIITGLEAGGAEAMLYSILRRIDQSRFMSFVISLTDRGRYAAQIEALGIPVMAIGMIRGRLPGAGALLRLASAIRRTRPDIVQSLMYHADLLGGGMAWISGFRNIAWGVHHSDFSRKRNKAWTLKAIRLCALLSHWLPRKVLVCSERTKEAHAGLGYRQDIMEFIPNGFDLAQWSPQADARQSLREELGLAVRTPLIGMIARFDPLKNHKGFLEAAARVRQALPDTHFLLAGTDAGPENRTIMDWIKALDLERNVHLLGQRSDVPRLMSALDILCSASFNEAFPLVIGEAMACGIPCVVTDAGDSAEIVGDCGRVVPIGENGALATAMIDLLTLPETGRAELGVRARKRIADKYEIGSVVRQYEQVYLDLLNAN